MCGITGVYEFARATGALEPALLRRMRETLHHRGPDGEGMYLSPDRRVGLAHRRLAIVDIDGGAQPMRGLAGEWLVFNGEIYNYPQLRRELERSGATFQTNCDTEVILHLYVRDGVECVRKLNGMFAFAIWDPARKQVFFARDPIGEKPLYWTVANGTFVFGSEIKALLEHPAVTAEVNETAISPYLTNLVTSAPETLYKGISKLAPGTRGICDVSGVHVDRYWDLFSPREWVDATPTEASGEVRRLLERSVRMRLMSDVPVGVLLSGGLDSSTLVALLQDRAAGMATFSVGTDDDPAIDERTEARWVADHFGTEHHEVVVSEADALEFLPTLVHHQDEPLADPVCIPLHFVCQLARANGVPVVLAGEGADEMFWGYPAYARTMTRARWLSVLAAMPSILRRQLPAMVPRRRMDRLFDLGVGLAEGRLPPMHMPLGLGRRQRELVLAGAAADTGWSPSVDALVPPGVIDSLAFDTQEYEFGLRLPELLLMRIDRFAMANSVEARVPFLDPDLVSFAYRLPLRHKLDGGQSKIVLRNAISDIVPQRILQRRKQGFGAPVGKWFTSKLGPTLESLMTGDSLRPYFDIDALRQLLARHRSGDAQTFVLWPILNFGLWHKAWIEGADLREFLDRQRGAA